MLILSELRTSVCWYLDATDFICVHFVCPCLLRVQLDRLEVIHSFPSCMFILGSDKDQREFSLSLHYNFTVWIVTLYAWNPTRGVQQCEHTINQVWIDHNNLLHATSENAFCPISKRLSDSEVGMSNKCRHLFHQNLDLWPCGLDPVFIPGHHQLTVFLWDVWFIIWK